ncbi:unnamed protein product [Symbiodinium sp. CCMP2592]|nr:unnamed protein product [Symbiodinium sp. CCMP2592]
MPWKCVRCRINYTHRRHDKVCWKCRPSQRGSTNRLVAVRRLPMKTRPSSRSKSFIWEHEAKQRKQSASDPQRLEQSPYNFKQLLEQQKVHLQTLFRNDMSKVHDVLGVGHAFFDKIQRRSRTMLPARTAINVAGLVSFAMANSGSLNDDDCYRLKYRQLLQLRAKDLSEAECRWLNIVGNMD